MKLDRITLGQTAMVEVTVSWEMRAAFNGETVHELYSSGAMLTHMEWAARQHILPTLEDGEEGVGVHLALDHLAPAPIGAQVRIVARVTDIQPGRVTCRCEAWHGERKIGEGEVVQAILSLTVLRARIPHQM